MPWTGYRVGPGGKMDMEYMYHQIKEERETTEREEERGTVRELDMLLTNIHKIISISRKHEEPSSRRSDRRVDTPDIIKLKDIRTPSRSSWDEDVLDTPSRSSAWDTMTPSHTSETEEELVSVRKKYVNKDTPLPTPTYRYNAWANERKSFGVNKSGNNDKWYCDVVFYR